MRYLNDVSYKDCVGKVCKLGSLTYQLYRLTAENITKLKTITNLI